MYNAEMWYVEKKLNRKALTRYYGKKDPQVNIVTKSLTEVLLNFISHFFLLQDSRLH